MESLERLRHLFKGRVDIHHRRQKTTNDPRTQIPQRENVWRIHGRPQKRSGGVVFKKGLAFEISASDQLLDVKGDGWKARQGLRATSRRRAKGTEYPESSSTLHR